MWYDNQDNPLTNSSILPLKITSWNSTGLLDTKHNPVATASRNMAAFEDVIAISDIIFVCESHGSQDDIPGILRRFGQWQRLLSLIPNPDTTDTGNTRAGGALWGIDRNFVSEFYTLSHHHIIRGRVFTLTQTCRLREKEVLRKIAMYKNSISPCRFM